MKSNLEPAGGPDVVEIAEVIAQANVVEHPAKASQRDAHAVGAAEPSELPAPFEVRFQVEDDARDAALGELLGKLRHNLGEVA